MSTEIKTSQINNDPAHIADAVMTKVIPTINELIEEKNTLEARVAALEAAEEDEAEEEGEETTEPPAPADGAEKTPEENQNGVPTLKDVLQDHVAELFIEAGYETIEDIDNETDEELLKIKGIAESRLTEVRQTLNAIR